MLPHQSTPPPPTIQATSLARRPRASAAQDARRRATHLVPTWAVGAALLLGGCPAPSGGPDAGSDTDGGPGDPADAGDVDAGPGEPRVRLVVGETSRGFVDGTGRGARFEGITCMEVSPDGSALYVSDTFNGTVRRIDTETGEVTTVGGQAQSFSTSDGVGELVRFTEPRGLGVSADGQTLWVADGPTLRSLDVTTGEALTWAGVPGEPGFVDGNAVGARIGFLVHDVAVSEDGATVLLADRSNDRIRVWDVAGETLSTLAGGGPAAADGTGAAAGFDGPGGVSRAGDTLYVADTFSHTLRALDVATGEVTTVAGQPGVSGATDGPVATARLDSPQGVAVRGEVLYAAGFDGLLRTVDLTAGTVDTLVGTRGQAPTALDGPAGVARLGGAFAPPVVHPTLPRLYYADLLVDSVRVVSLDDGSVTTLAGPVMPEAHVDGSLEEARFGWLSGVAASADGRTLYLADPSHAAVRVVSLDGDAVTTLDEPQGESPVGLALDEAAGALFVSDAGLGTVTRRDLASGEVTPVGTATFASPWGLALDGATLYVADYDGRQVHQIDVDTGETSVLAGSGLAGGQDGPAASASFQGPLALAFAGATRILYVSDYAGLTVRAIDVEQGTVSTVAGDGQAGADDGTPGRLQGPSGLALRDDELFIADTNNHVLRVLDLAAGDLRTAVGRAGLPASIGAGPGVPASEATFTSPEALAVTAEGLLVTVEYSVQLVPWAAVGDDG